MSEGHEIEYIAKAFGVTCEEAQERLNRSYDEDARLFALTVGSMACSSLGSKEDVERTAEIERAIKAQSRRDRGLRG